jgi:hypothetical protein
VYPEEILVRCGLEIFQNLSCPFSGFSNGSKKIAAKEKHGELWVRGVGKPVIFRATGSNSLAV